MGKWLLSISFLALAAAAASAAEDNSEAQDLPLDMSSKELTFDAKTNLFHAIEPRIKQGGMSIEADEASATNADFKEHSEWRFTGHVRINVDSALLQADHAVFTFEAKQLTHAELQGNPASVTDHNTAHQEPIRGGADKLDYDYEAHTLRLSGQAWINKGRTEIQGCDLIYDFNDERVTSGSSDCGVRISIRSQTDGASNRSDSGP